MLEGSVDLLAPYHILTNVIGLCFGTGFDNISI